LLQLEANFCSVVFRRFFTDSKGVVWLKFGVFALHFAVSPTPFTDSKGVKWRKSGEMCQFFYLIIFRP
jgi:hypothetical protein